MAAASKVFGIYELLEDIILHLSLQQIIILQRVNNFFKEVVQDSSKIRKALFLEPASDRRVVWKQRNEAGMEFEGVWRDTRDGSVPVLLQNPLLELVQSTGLCARGGPRKPSPKSHGQYFKGVNLFEYGFGKAILGFYSGSGVRFRTRCMRRRFERDFSGGQMLFTDPPITEAAIVKVTYMEFYTRGGGAEYADGPLKSTLSDVLKPEQLRIADIHDYNDSKNSEDDDVYGIGSSREWRPVPKGYLITGWEMLRLLETAGEERKYLLWEMLLAAYPDYENDNICDIYERGVSKRYEHCKNNRIPMLRRRGF